MSNNLVKRLRNSVEFYHSHCTLTMEAADRIEQLAQKVKDLTAERDDAWRICATWRKRAHAAEALEKDDG